MRTLPSKELLSAVLGYEILDEYIILGNQLQFKSWKVDDCEIFTNSFKSINIYELQHMMKEWALEQGYELTSNNNFCYVDLVLSTMGHYAVRVDFIADSEPEAVTKACEWILKEISK